ncbi:hypothetical protein BLA29_013591 [Euroglyphus maynei]|uniref:Uncharacterized protein n=1 Tax=Euroglyphus maynei TaxID=6958 RepID=A0A1Y3AY30_EURMA|nr:hypothetical protein BLA29_013591 [Euroglyphus maynei]
MLFVVQSSRSRKPQTLHVKHCWLVAYPKIFQQILFHKLVYQQIRQSHPALVTLTLAHTMLSLLVVLKQCPMYRFVIPVLCVKCY